MKKLYAIADWFKGFRYGGALSGFGYFLEIVLLKIEPKVIKVNEKFTGPDLANDGVLANIVSREILLKTEKENAPRG